MHFGNVLICILFYIRTATQIHDSFLKVHLGQQFLDDAAEAHKISLGIPERAIKTLENF